MSTASVVPNAIPVLRTDGHWMAVDCPEGWDDVKKICRKVLLFEGRHYTFTGWNSDRNEAFFTVSTKFAAITKVK